MEPVEVKAAAGAVRRCLLNGGSCFVRSGSIERIVVHDPALHRPAARLPWPLSKLQPHVTSYTEMTDGQISGQRNFDRAELDAAVAYFLRDMPPSTIVVITPDSAAA